MKNRIFKWLVHHCQKIICVVLFLSCVITVYYGHIKDRMYQKIINTIKSENELIADTNSGIWSFARRDNLEFLLDNIQSNRLLQLNAINLSSFVVMQYTDSYSFCLCWVTFIHQITSIKLSIDNEGDSVTIEIPDMVLSIFENAFQDSFIELHAPAFFVTRACSRHEAQIKHFRYVITFQFRKEEEKHIHYPCKMNAKIIPRVHVNSTQYN